jgi:leukotriene-A4 hydrolase
VKMTYSAIVTVEKPLRALMSASTVEDSTDLAPSRFACLLSKDTSTLMTYAFSQKQPMPAYLLALAVGQVESRKIGPRSRIWAEPSVVDAAAWEFDETESFLAAGVTPLTPNPSTVRTRDSEPN